jgi:short-subunit dehydrogenase
MLLKIKGIIKIYRETDNGTCYWYNILHKKILYIKKAGNGNIIIMSSLAGIVPEIYSSIYTVNKFALRGLNLT